MKWSFRLGRFLGIDVRVHATFFILLAFIAVAYWLPSGNFGDALGGLAFFLALFVCVLLHEYGHALAARRYGVGTHDITLLPIGGVARLERMPDSPGQELWIALAGPAVNVVIAGLLALGLALSGHAGMLTSVDAMNGSFTARLLAVNLFLVAFNLVPAFPMDGGRVLRAVLAMRLNYARATRIAANVGQAVAVIFGLVGLLGNPMLVLIALFVWIGAGEEAAAAEMKDALSGIQAHEAMITDFVALTPRESVGAAARLLLAGSQRDFPVIEEGTVVGILTHDRLIRALRDAGEAERVETFMNPVFDSAQGDEPLNLVLARRDPERSAVVPVYSGSQLIGLITPDNVGELFMIRSALAQRPPRRGPPPLPRVTRRHPEEITRNAPAPFHP